MELRENQNQIINKSLFMRNLIVHVIYTVFLAMNSHGLVFASEKNNNSKNFIGNLNNVKFEFTQNHIRNVEYNGDPGWGYEKRKEEIRGWNSTFRSFGFRMNYSDFMLLKNSESSKNIIRVTLTAGEYYGDGFFLERSFQSINRNPNYFYTELKPIYEIRYFQLTTDSSKVKKSVMRDFDIYVKNNKDGKVSTLIRCGNAHENRSICQHFFLIDEFKAIITLYYKREFLHNWKLIQSRSISTLEEFRK